MLSPTVVYITPGGSDGRGGMGRFARYVQRAAAEQPDGPRLIMLDSYGPGAFWAMPAWFALACLRLIGLCLFGRVDLVHLHTAMNGSVLRKLILAALARGCGVPVVLHIHGSDFHLFADALPGWLRRLMVGQLGKCARIVALGAMWREYLVEGLGLAPDLVTVIHNGVPFPETLPQHDDGPCTLLSLGQLGPRKGTPELIAALGRLADRPWRAVLAGDGEVERSRDSVRRLGLENRLLLPGWVGEAEARRLLDEADIFVLPSRTEGLPVALLEAMAAGLAVVTTPVGAIPSVVEDGVTGLLVPPGSVDDLTAALSGLLEDEGRRQGLGQAARRLIYDSFTINKTTQRLFGLYAEVSCRPVSRELP